MKEFDPVKFEIIRHRLKQILIEAGQALLHVSGSTVVTEVGEHVEALYRADGELALAGGGILLHVLSGTQAIKYIIKEYSEEPGIHEGDMFFFNDPYIATLHAPDQFVLAPIFYKGELIAWIGTLTHTHEVGGMSPGGIMPQTKECYQEGVQFPGVKIMRKGEFAKDVFNSIMTMVRAPHIVGFDLKAKIAGCNVGTKRILEIIDKYGKDTIVNILDELILYSERKAREKLMGIPDGEWNAVLYNKIESYDMRYEGKAFKKGDSLIFDFTGTSEQMELSLNCHHNAAMGGLFDSIAGWLFYNIPWNSGLMHPIEVNIPEGSLLNCNKPAAVSSAVPNGGVDFILVLGHILIGKMLLASEDFKEEAFASWGSTHSTFTLAGVNQYNEYYVTMPVDAMAMGLGALKDKDGCDSGAGHWSPRSIIANVETYESLYPVLYLFKRHRMDSGGAGKYRGGVSIESMFTPYDIPEDYYQYIVTFGMGYEFPSSIGLSGGYPGSIAGARVKRDTDIFELFNQGYIPSSIDELKGKPEDKGPFDIYPIKKGDILYCSCGGGGGYGDPLDRDPQMVKTDIDNRLVSPRAAYDIYGVIINGSDVNIEKTEKRRKEIKEARLKG